MSADREAEPLERAPAGTPRGVPAIASLGDAFPAGILVLDAAGRGVYANPRVQALLGLSAGELAEEGFLPAVDAADRSRIESEFAAALAAASEWQAEFRCRHRDDTVLHNRAARRAAAQPRGRGQRIRRRRRRRQPASRLYTKLTALIETSRILLDTPRLDAVLPAAVQVARNLIAADGYALWRLQDDGGWRIVVSNGVSAAFAAAVVPQRESTYSRFDTPLAVNDVEPQRGWPTARRPTGRRGSAPFWRCRCTFAAAGRAAWSSTTSSRSSSTTFDRKRQPPSATCAPSPSRRRSCTRSSCGSGGAARTGPSAIDVPGPGRRHPRQLARLRSHPRRRRAAGHADIADWCAVDIADDTGRLKQLGTAHINTAKLEFARTLRDRFRFARRRPARRRTSSARGSQS